MNKPIHLKFNLRELEAWMAKSTGISLKTFKGRVPSFIRVAEDCPPFRLQTILRPLIIDEAVDADDLILTVVDEETGEEHHYNPHHSLHAIFDGLVPNPPTASDLRGAA